MRDLFVTVEEYAPHVNVEISKELSPNPDRERSPSMTPIAARALKTSFLAKALWRKFVARSGPVCRRSGRTPHGDDGPSSCHLSSLRSAGLRPIHAPTGFGTYRPFAIVGGFYAG